MNLDACTDFLEFVAERHRIWERRQETWGQEQWTDDPILASRKFTNVFRILDPGTQFLMTDLFPGASPTEALLRAFLYRHTGRVETWQYLDVVLGGYPTIDTLEDVRETWKTYRDGDDPQTRVRKGRWSGEPTVVVDPLRPFFTNAYLVFPQSGTPGTDKLDSIIDLTQRVITPEFVAEWEGATRNSDRFFMLRAHKGVGDFMSMQVLTDWGYNGTVDHENEVVFPGPGAVKGARLLDDDLPILDIINWAVEAIHAMPDCPVLPGGSARKPSLMDVQNCLCEFSKYARLKPGDPYRPAHPGLQPELVLPSYYNMG